MPQLTMLDRNGEPITAGARLKIQVCSGPYGSTETITGDVTSIDTAFMAVNLILEKDRRVVIRGEVSIQKAGTEISVHLPGKQKDGVFTAYSEHVDVEHGHEAFAEVIGQKQVQTQSAAPKAAPARKPRP